MVHDHGNTEYHKMYSATLVTARDLGIFLQRVEPRDHQEKLQKDVPVTS